MSNNIVISSLSLIFTVSVASQCGIAEHNSYNQASYRNPYIVGGREARPHAYPWQVSLRRFFDCYHFCGGSLVSEKWVVTAAHCLTAGQTVFVALGEHTVCENIYTNTIQSSRVILHPNFNLRTMDSDIAMVELERGVVYSDKILPVCLPWRSSRDFVVTGWGTTSENGNIATKLQEIEVPIIENCEIYYSSITENMLCAGYLSGGKNTCQGDSGGPLMYHDNGVWYLLGRPTTQSEF